MGNKTAGARPQALPAPEQPAKTATFALSARPAHRARPGVYVKTLAVFFPFDLFGSGGTAAGAELLADGFREMLADNRRERIPTRALAYQQHVRMRELSLATMSALQGWRDTGRRAVKQAWAAGDFLLWVTGNHLGVLPVYDELANQSSGTLVIQLDAHLDIYNLSDCTAELSHGNFLLHCTGALPPLINVGHRELLLEPQYVAKYYRRAFSADELARQTDRVIASLKKEIGRARRVFLDIDCDVLDAAYFPGAAHSLPFGLSPFLLLRVVATIASHRLAGVAISEFAPARDQGDRSLALLLWLLEHLLIQRYEKEAEADRKGGRESSSR
jgi:arginase family enzyme